MAQDPNQPVAAEPVDWTAFGITDPAALGIKDPREVAKQLFEADEKRKSEQFQKSVNEHFTQSRGRITPEMLVGGAIDTDKMLDKYYDFNTKSLQGLTPTEQASAYATAAVVNEGVKEAGASSSGGTKQVDDTYAAMMARLVPMPEGMSDEEIEDLAKRIYGNQPIPEFATVNSIDPNARGFLLGMGLGRLVQGGGISAAVSDVGQMVTGAMTQAQQEMNQRFIKSKAVADNDAAMAKFEYEVKSDQFQKQVNHANTLNQGILANMRTDAQIAGMLEGKDRDNATKLQLKDMTLSGNLQKQFFDTFGKNRNNISPEDWSNTVDMFRVAFSNDPEFTAMMDELAANPRELTQAELDKIALRQPKINMYNSIASANMGKAAEGQAKALWYKEQTLYISQRYQHEVDELAEAKRQFETRMNFDTAKVQHATAQAAVDKVRTGVGLRINELTKAKAAYDEIAGQIKVLSEKVKSGKASKEEKAMLTLNQGSLASAEREVLTRAENLHKEKSALYGSMGDGSQKDKYGVPIYTYGTEEAGYPGSLYWNLKEAKTWLEKYSQQQLNGGGTGEQTVVPNVNNSVTGAVAPGGVAPLRPGIIGPRAQLAPKPSTARRVGLA